jgi:hypothetical protein
MTSSVRDFIAFWIQNSVHAGEQYAAGGGSRTVGDLANRCVEMAVSQGISKAEMERAKREISIGEQY